MTDSIKPKTNMRHCIILLLFLASTLSFSNALYGQDFSQIDARARRITAPSNQDVNALAALLSAGCKNEKEKARSFFVWMADNIHYDVKMLGKKGGLTPEKLQDMQSPEEVLKRKKAVCEGYTNLYNALCSSVGIRALTVGGVSKKQNGIVSRNGHAWSLISIDGQWALVDPTWGAGVVDTDEGKYHEKLDDKYFCTAPETLLEDHYPNDPLFQCVTNPLNLEEFGMSALKQKETLAQKKTAGPTPGFAHVADSLNTLFPFDSLHYLFGAGQRSLQVNPRNNYGSWSVGQYYYQQSAKAREAYYKAINDLKPVGYYASEAWFDAQVATLNRWEAGLDLGLKMLKKASGQQDRYSTHVYNLQQNIQNSLNACQSIIAQNQRLKAAVKKGTKVKMTTD